MSHLSDGALLALRDRTLALHDASDAAHLSVCAECTAALAEVERRSVRVERALSAIDGSFDLESARATVRGRIESGTSTERRGALWSGRHLARAAGVLLVLAGGAAALPGSPLRVWLADRATAEQGAAPEGAVEAIQPVGAPETTSVRVPAGDVGVVVSLEGVRVGDMVEVAVGAAGEVGLVAPAGTVFATGAGRISGRVAPGDVRVELPPGVEGSVVVNGRTLVRSGVQGLEPLAPVDSRAPRAVRFRVVEN